jgi:hypothetical protein
LYLLALDKPPPKYRLLFRVESALLSNNDAEEDFLGFRELPRRALPLEDTLLVDKFLIFGRYPKVSSSSPSSLLSIRGNDVEFCSSGIFTPDTIMWRAADDEGCIVERLTLPFGFVERNLELLGCSDKLLLRLFLRSLNIESVLDSGCRSLVRFEFPPPRSVVARALSAAKLAPLSLFWGRVVRSLEGGVVW